MLDKILAFMRLKSRVSGQNRGNLSDCVELLNVINQESYDVSSNCVSKTEFATFIRKTRDLLVTGRNDLIVFICLLIGDSTSYYNIQTLNYNKRSVSSSFYIKLTDQPLAISRVMMLM